MRKNYKRDQKTQEFVSLNEIREAVDSQTRGRLPVQQLRSLWTRRSLKRLRHTAGQCNGISVLLRMIIGLGGD